MHLHLIGNAGRLALIAASGIMLSAPSIADEHIGNWVSNPRALVTIVVGEDGGRISGPEWEYRFAAGTSDLDFEIEPGRRLVLHREGETWVGEYFHPRIRPGDSLIAAHSMLFVRAKVASR